MAVDDPGKYVSLLDGQLNDEEQKAERDEEKRSYEKELFSVSEKNRLLEDSKLQLLHACEKERDRSLKKELLSVREENRIREDSKVELQHSREEAAELRNHIKEADMQPTIEKIVNLLPTELRAEIKKTSSWNQLGARKNTLQGESRAKQIKVCMFACTCAQKKLTYV
jgi:hypothetical protein